MTTRRDITAAFQVPCPRCEAPPRERCVSRKGIPIDQLHPERIVAAGGPPPARLVKVRGAA